MNGEDEKFEPPPTDDAPDPDPDRSDESPAPEPEADPGDSEAADED